MSAQPKISPNSSETAEQVLRLALGYMGSSALYIAIRLNIADLLSAGPRPVHELARESGALEGPLYRVLRALASLGIFTESAPGEFALNSAAELLRRGNPVRDLSEWMTDAFHFRTYAHLIDSVRSGASAMELATGDPPFDHFRKNPELGELFNRAMTAFSALVIPAVLEAYDFSGIGMLIDVGGGHGYVLASILEKYPAMKGILFELENVAPGAQARFEKMGLSSRARVLTGDFFQSVPAGGDAYIMKSIIHDWDDEKAGRLLRNIHQAMTGKGKVILLESVIEPGDTVQLGKLIDLEMLAGPGGRERTREEFRDLFARAGFRLTRIVPTSSPMSVIEAERV